jgi:hypothetical protein
VVSCLAPFGRAGRKIRAIGSVRAARRAVPAPASPGAWKVSALRPAYMLTCRFACRRTTLDADPEEGAVYARCRRRAATSVVLRVLAAAKAGDPR